MELLADYYLLQLTNFVKGSSPYATDKIAYVTIIIGQ